MAHSQQGPERKSYLPAWRSLRRALITLMCAGVVSGWAAGLDVSGVWTLSAQCPIATIQITSNAGGTSQKQLDLNSYATISGMVVVQAPDGSLSMPGDGTFRGQVNGTTINFSKYTSWWEATPSVSYTVGVSYSGTVSGSSISGAAEITYQENGFDGRRVYWYGVGTTTGSFGGGIMATLPVILAPPVNQTAESGSTVEFRVEASGTSPLTCLWYFNSTQVLSNITGYTLQLRNVQFSQAGSYSAVVANSAGTVTSSPAMLQVIAPVARTPIPGLQLSGETGRALNLEYTDSLSAPPNWQPLGSVDLASSPTTWFDPDATLLADRFYRAWQAAPAGVVPSLRMRIFPAISLTGNIGDSFRLDCINQFGPIDAWAALDTIKLTNTTQRYVDVSAPGAPPRLYRVVKVP